VSSNSAFGEVYTCTPYNIMW